MDETPRRLPPIDAGDIHRQRGQLLMELRRYEEACREFLQWLSETPEDPRAHAKLGYCYSRMNKFELALEHAQKAVSLEPDSYDFNLNLGICFFNCKQPEKALEPLQFALRHSPESYDAQDRLARTYLLLDNRDQALAHADKALELCPEKGGAWLLKGRVLIRLKRIDEALAALRVALQHDPENSDAYYNIGVCYVAQGLREHARAQFEETLRIHPVDTLAQAELTKLNEVVFPGRFSLFEGYSAGIRLYAKVVKWALSQTAICILLFCLAVAYCVAYLFWRDQDWVAWTLSIAPLLPAFAISEVVILPVSYTLFPTELRIAKFPRWKRTALRLLTVALLVLWGAAAYGIARWNEWIFGTALVGAYIYLAVSEYVLVVPSRFASAAARNATSVVLLAIGLAFVVFVVDQSADTWAAKLLENAIGWLAMISYVRCVGRTAQHESEPATGASSTDAETT